MAASQRILLGHIKGDKGDQGDPATVRVGTVGATAPGNAPQVNPGGTPRDLILNFVIPTGQTGPGGGTITPLRSHALPMVYRTRMNDLVPGGGAVLGAMDLLGWYPHAQWGSTRINYFTTHPTEGVLQGWRRTAFTPVPEREMFWTRSCPINFGSLGYRGNWCRSHVFSDSFHAPSYIGSGADLWYGYRGRDFDGLVFTNTNQALWIYGRGGPRQPPNGGGNILTLQAITLVGLTATAITSMWAGIDHMNNWIWVIQSNTLRLLHIQNSESGSYGSFNSAIRRRITSAADMPFVPVANTAGTGALFANGALPTTMYRVYAEGPFAVVWGTAAGRINTALAYFNGTSWAALTAPCQVNGIPNSVIIFPTGRLAVFNNSTGDYYTCDNPMAGAGATWRLRYRVENGNKILTNCFARGLPQFLPRGFNWTVQPVFSEFDATSHDGGTLYRNPLGTDQQMFAWPGELFCSVTRPEIIPSINGYQGYGAYVHPYGMKTSYVSLYGDNKTALATADWSPSVYSYQTWEAGVASEHIIPVPPGLSPASPVSYFAASLRRGPATFTDNANRNAGAIYVADPGFVAAG